MNKKIFVRDNIFCIVQRKGSGFVKKYIKSNKFFWELPKKAHLDRQYGKYNLSHKDIINELKYLLKEFSELCNKNDIKVVIMHGTLIGWMFNKKILPWDDDIDIVIVGKSIINLFKINGFQTETYILKINPYSKNRNIKDRHNVIDARIISKRNGVFIDITFLTNTKNKKGYINCKSPHYYRINDILPLKQDKFENCDVYVPNNYKRCLAQEYGMKVFKPFFKEWKFIGGKWIK